MKNLVQLEMLIVKRCVGVKMAGSAMRILKRARAPQVGLEKFVLIDASLATTV